MKLQKFSQTKIKGKNTFRRGWEEDYIIRTNDSILIKIPINFIEAIAKDPKIKKKHIKITSTEHVNHWVSEWSIDWVTYSWTQKYYHYNYP